MQRLTKIKKAGGGNMLGKTVVKTKLLLSLFLLKKRIGTKTKEKDTPKAIKHTAGDHCFHCPRKCVCSLHTEACKFLEEKIQALSDIKAMDTKTLEIIYAKSLLAEQYLKQISEVLFTTAKNGVPLKQHEIKEGRKGRRYFKSPAEVVEKLKDYLKIGDIYTLKSPAKLAEAGVNKEVLEPLLQKGAKGFTLAPKSSSKPEVKYEKTSEEFDWSKVSIDDED